jgi:hypothetical protein
MSEPESEPESFSPPDDRPPIVQLPHAQTDPVQPYLPPGVTMICWLDQEAIVLAEALDERPLLWPTFLTVLFAIGGALIVSGIALGVAGAVSGGMEVFRGTREFNEWLTRFAATDQGLAVLVLPGQLTFCAVALIAAAFSRENVVDRLGLRRGHLPPWTWPLFLVGTPVVGMVMAQLMSRVIEEPSEQLQMLENLFESHAAGSMAILLVLISLLPGLVEELLFRGFMQRRLLVRLPAVVAIGVTTAFFAAAHVDPMHAVGVAPLGIWLGVVAWRADSIWPAVFGHVGNNAYAIVMSVMMGPDPNPEQMGPAVTGTLGLAVLAFLGCLVLLTIPRSSRRVATVAAATPPQATNN